MKLRGLGFEVASRLARLIALSATAGAVLLCASSGAQTASFQVVYPTNPIGPYWNAPQPGPDGTVLLANTNPAGPFGYQTGVGGVGIPQAYNAGDFLQFGALVCSPTASAGNPTPLGLGVQNGSGDQNDLTSTIGAPGTFQFITTTPVTVDVPKGTIFFFIPGSLGQQVLLQYLVLGDPASVAAFGTSHSDLIGTKCESIRTTHNGGLVVGAGEAMLLTPGADIHGGVTVQPGGSFQADGATIRGGLDGDGATSVGLCGSSVSGSVSVLDSSGPVTVGDADANPTCNGNTIDGSVKVDSNNGGVAVSDNTISGSLELESNTGGADVVGNERPDS
jgi:hypothetical protein